MLTGSKVTSLANFVYLSTCPRWASVKQETKRNQKRNRKPRLVNYVIIIPTHTCAPLLKLVWLRLSIILAYLTSACVLILNWPVVGEWQAGVWWTLYRTRTKVWSRSRLEASQEECRFIGAWGCCPINMQKIRYYAKPKTFYLRIVVPGILTLRIVIPSILTQRIVTGFEQRRSQ